MYVRIIVHNVVHSITQNSSDNFPSYPPDNSSDDVYWRRGECCSMQYIDKLQRDDVLTQYTYYT